MIVLPKGIYHIIKGYGKVVELQIAKTEQHHVEEVVRKVVTAHGVGILQPEIFKNDKLIHILLLESKEVQDYQAYQKLYQLRFRAYFDDCNSPDLGVYHVEVDWLIQPQGNSDLIPPAHRLVSKVGAHTRQFQRFWRQNCSDPALW